VAARDKTYESYMQSRYAKTCRQLNDTYQVQPTSTQTMGELADKLHPVPPKTRHTFKK
jgi:hypothetical protein